MDQVKQREQEYPYQVNKVPVKSCVFEPDVVGLMDVVIFHLDYYINEKTYSDQYVQRMYSGHEEI